MKFFLVATVMAIGSLIGLRRRPKPLPPTRHAQRQGILDTQA